jgi:uncharacterized protein YcnI
MGDGTRTIVRGTAAGAARRAAARVGGAVAAAGAALVLVPAPAHAHVEIQPGQVEGGDFAVVAFRVPNERDDASTTRLRVILPRDQPLGSVQTTATPGWTVSTVSRGLAEPIEMFGAELDEVVSEVTWTATGRGVGPGQFEDFRLSLGQLPTSGSLVFTAVQTYSSGEQVRWNEVSDGTAEPEHPAPTLEVAPADADAPESHHSEAPSVTVSAGDTTAAADPVAQEVPTPVLPLVLSSVALVVALGAAGLAWRRGRA